MLRVFNDAVDRDLSNGRKRACAARTAPGRCRNPRRRPGVESLEDRRLLSGGLHGLSHPAAGLGLHHLPAHVAAHGNGSLAIDPSSAITSRQVSPVGIPGPQVINVQRFGYHNLRTVVVLTFNTFSQGLNPTTAQDVNNYTITPANGVGTQPQVILALYRPGDANVHDMVTLFLNGPTVNLHRPYTLTVNGSTATGVSNNEGVLLDGLNNGTPGTNFTTTLLGFFGGNGPAGSTVSAATALHHHRRS